MAPHEDSNVTRAALHHTPPPPSSGSANTKSGRSGVIPAGALAFGDYEVVAELGEGGMGRVYKAVDRKLSRTVAIKVLRAPDEFEASRFRGEAEITARLDHPNIIRIFEIETTEDGRTYLVLEFAEGGSLDKELRGQPQEPRRAAEAAAALAWAIQYAHEQGVIHRDLKPANILRAKDGTLKLTDFGLAKQYEVASGMTPTGAVMGTPSYMAPEQAAGNVREVGPAADVYGLGAILYELLTGRPPFRGVNMVETLEQVRWSDPAPPSRLVPRLHKDLGTICLKCLAKTPSRRYATARDLAVDLRRWLDGETIAARPAPAWERAWRQMRRRPWEAAAIVAGGLVAVLLVVGIIYLQRTATEEKVRTEKEAADALVLREKEDAALKFQQAQEVNARRLRDRSKKSLDAIDGIRTLVLEGDLRRVPGLDPLNRKLFDYYQRLVTDFEAEPEHEPAQLAAACVKIGELIYRTGKKDDARWAYGKAADFYQGLVAGGAAEYRPDLAESRLNLARVAYDLGDDAETATLINDSEKLWERVRDDAKTPAARAAAVARLAEVLHLRGELLAREGKRPESIASYLASIELRGPPARVARGMTPDALAALPADERRAALKALRELARGYGYIGDVYLDARMTQEADRAYWTSHRLREKVVEAHTLVNPPSEEDRLEATDGTFQLARSWGNFANFQARNRANATAMYFARLSQKMRTELARDNPNDVANRMDLWDSATTVARLVLVSRVPPGGEGWKASVDALTNAIVDPPHDSSSTSGHSYRVREQLAESHALLGQLLADTDRPRARSNLERAAALLAELSKGGNDTPANLLRAAACEALLAEFDGGQPTAIVRRDQALAALDLAVQKGYREHHPDDLRALRAFRSLAGNARFEEILGQIEFD